MNQTGNYGLSQWEKSDRIQMEDFNSDNVKIDTALKGLADSVAGKIGASDLQWVKLAETENTAEASQLSLSVANAGAYRAFHLVADYVCAATAMSLSWGGSSSSLYTVSKLATGSHCSLVIDITSMPSGGILGLVNMYSSLLSDTAFYLSDAPTSGTVTVSIQPNTSTNVFATGGKMILYGLKKC